jgi:hypothetical protein
MLAVVPLVLVLGVDVGRLVFLEWDAGIKELKGIAASGLITLIGVSPFTMISINV